LLLLYSLLLAIFERASLIEFGKRFEHSLFFPGLLLIRSEEFFAFAKDYVN
jgi:hypothetical protein